jgi:thermitase
MAKTQRRKEVLPERVPSFEGIIVSLGEAGANAAEGLRIAHSLAKRTGLEKWQAEPVGAGDYVLTPPARVRVTQARAWTLTRKLITDRAVADAEPAFRTRGHDPHPTQLALRGVKAAFLFPDVTPRPGALADCEWSLKLCRIPEAWAYSQAQGRIPYGENVVVAHPDTGYTTHPDFFDPARVDAASGYDFFTGQPDPLDPLSGENPSHGTSTGSVIASGIGPDGVNHVTGAAPEARLVPLRTNDSVMYFSYLNLCRALYFAADKGWSVASMSLGGAFSSKALLRALQYAADKGMILVAASGNYYPTVVYPARYEETIAACACNVDVLNLGAANIADGIWKYAAKEDDVDVTAPGETVWRARTEPGGVYLVAPSDGTSYATATVAGIAALWLAHHGLDTLRQRYPGRQLPTVFKELVMTAGVDVPRGWRTDLWGAGVINALKVLQAPLPDTPRARGFRRLSRRNVASEGPLDRIVRHFPEVPPDRARKAIMEAFGQSERELHRTLESYGSELEFLVATDPDARQGLLNQMRPIRARRAREVGKALPVSQVLSAASPELRKRLAR